MATFHIWQGDLYESWCTGDGPYRRVASASLGARELRPTGTARKKLASRHPRRNEEEGHREILLKSALEQQLVLPAEINPYPRREHLWMLMLRVLHSEIRAFIQHRLGDA